MVKAGAAPVDIARVYDRHPCERYRVLVDRLWPRGVAKADAPIEEWLRDIAPSTDLRRWYGHDPARFPEFTRRYHGELGEPPAAAAVVRMTTLAATRPLRLVTATRDLDHSGARVLCDHLLGILSDGSRQ